MFGFPLEIITGLGSALIGAFLKLKAQDNADKAMVQQMMLERYVKKEESIQSAREFQSSSANWIRRFLVISFIAMASFILIAPLLGQNIIVPIQVQTGFLFWQETITKFVSLDGIVTPDWLGHAIMSVTSMYFGQSIVSRKHL